MEAKRWTLGVVLAAAVSLFGLIQADASPFSTYILSDDLGNVVNGTAPSVDGSGSEDSTATGECKMTAGGEVCGSGEGTDSADQDGNYNQMGQNADGTDATNGGGDNTDAGGDGGGPGN